MPCRPQVCRRLVARAPSTKSSSTNGAHIWISDDLLAEAFNSYLRVSPAYRRYGSHVPGPLEAHRRAARRRMGGGLVGVGAPLPPDMGALFGLGGATAQPSWSWQAPTPPERVAWRPPVPAKAPPWPFATTVGPLPERELGNIEEGDPGLTATEISSERFETLLESHDQTGGDLEPLAQFLYSTANEPEAMNTLRLVEWLCEHSRPSSTATTLTTLLTDKVKLETISREEFVEVLRLLPNLKLEESIEAIRLDVHAMYTSIWSALPRDWAQDLSVIKALLNALATSIRDMQMCSLSQDILTASTNAQARLLSTQDLTIYLGTIVHAITPAGREATQRADTIDKLVLVLDQIGDYQDLDASTLSTWTGHIVRGPASIEERKATCSVWLSILRRCKHTADHGAAWDAVYAGLAPHLRPSDISEHFKEVRSIDLARVLLKSWLPHADRDGYGMINTHRLREAGAFRVLRAPQKSLTATALPAILKTFDDQCEQGLMDAGRAKLTHPLALLLTAFARNSIAYDGIATELMLTCRLMYAPAQLHNTFSAIFNCPDLSISKSIAVDLVQHFVEVNEPTRALQIFTIVPSISIADCPELPTALIAMGKTDVDLISRFQQRQPEVLTRGRRAAPNLTAVQSHTDAIRLMAHELSRSEAMNARTALRRVWGCYRYLRDRGAHLSLLMSRALVHVGLVRFLRQGQIVPEMRIDWILKIVQEVEGEAMAAEVRALLYLIQRKVAVSGARQHKHRPLKWLPAGDIGATRWRLKTWAKQRPKAVVDENEATMSYVVPSLLDESGALDPDNVAPGGKQLDYVPAIHAATVLTVDSQAGPTSATQTYTYNPRAAQCVTIPAAKSRSSEKLLVTQPIAPTDHTTSMEQSTPIHDRECRASGSASTSDRASTSATLRWAPQLPQLMPKSENADRRGISDCDSSESALALEYLAESIDALASNATPPKETFHPPLRAPVRFERVMSFADTKLSPRLQTLFERAGSEVDIRQSVIEDEIDAGSPGHMALSFATPAAQSVDAGSPGHKTLSFATPAAQSVDAGSPGHKTLSFATPATQSVDTRSKSELSSRSLFNEGQRRQLGKRARLGRARDKAAAIDELARSSGRPTSSLAASVSGSHDELMARDFSRAAVVNQYIAASERLKASGVPHSVVNDPDGNVIEEKAQSTVVEHVELSKAVEEAEAGTHSEAVHTVKLSDTARAALVKQYVAANKNNRVIRKVLGRRPDASMTR